MALWSTLWCSSWIYLKTVAGETLFVNGAAKLFALCSPWWQNAFVIFADSLKIILTDKSCSPTSWKDSVSRQDENECRSSAVRVNWNSPANVVEVADLLMDAGCHLNQPDANGVTPPTFSGIASPAFCGWNTGHAPNLEDLIHNVVLPLTCYCAQTIRKHKIPFKKRIPPVVESFVERHGELPWIRAADANTQFYLFFFCAENIMFCFDVFVCHYSRTSWII